MNPKKNKISKYTQKNSERKIAKENKKQNTVEKNATPNRHKLADYS